MSSSGSYRYSGKENAKRRDKIVLPLFSENYRVIERGDGTVLTVCELVDTKRRNVLTYGIAKVHGKENYKASVAKLISYGKAVKRLISRQADIKVNDKEILDAEKESPSTSLRGRA